ncbi:MAG: RNA polymerase sigma factor [Roseburia sp.]|nr:RNA polymerase sigma factor [Roseburia sp.]
MNDEEIIGLYWERNQQAIPATEVKYGKFLKRIAYNILFNEQDSEECVNDTYLNTWNCIPPQKPTYFQAFLGAITRNLSIDRYKQQHAKKRVPSEMTTLLSELETVLTTGQDVQKEVEDKEIAVHISTFLRTLEVEKRAIFIRRYWHCDDIKNIAQDFGCSESKIKASLFRTREKLKLYLEKEGIRV